MFTTGRPSWRQHMRGMQYQIVLNISFWPELINTVVHICVQNSHTSSVYSPFADRVGLPPHNTPFPRVLMKSIGAGFLRPDSLPDVRGMQCQIVINFHTKQQYEFIRCKSPFSRLLRHNWVKAVMLFYSCITKQI